MKNDCFKHLVNIMLSAVLLFTAPFVGAQNLCPNIDFSMRNFTNWTCQTSTSSGTQNTAYSALTWTGLAAVAGRHTIITDILGV